MFLDKASAVIQRDAFSTGVEGGDHHQCINAKNVRHAAARMELVRRQPCGRSVRYIPQARMHKRIPRHLLTNASRVHNAHGRVVSDRGIRSSGRPPKSDRWSGQ